MCNLKLKVLHIVYVVISPINDYGSLRIFIVTILNSNFVFIFSKIDLCTRTDI